MSPLIFTHKMTLSILSDVNTTQHQRLFTEQHNHRMVGWLKNFVQTRALPAASLVKGYTIHMLARRAPFSLAHDFEMRRSTYGADMAKRGHLTLASTMVAKRQDKPGCGKIFVNLSRRNSREYAYERLPADFKRCFEQYDNTTLADKRFNTNRRRIQFVDILKGHHMHILTCSTSIHARTTFTLNVTTGPAVTINGRPLPMMNDVNLGIRYIYNREPAYGDIKRVIYARQNNDKHAVFLEVAPRQVIEEQRTVCAVKESTSATIYIETMTSLTHIVIFAPHPTQPLGSYMCLKVWATKPGWEIK
jgi:hypothetical protein